MNGQWIGRYAGTNGGMAVVDLDDIGDRYQGAAFVYDDNDTLPGTFAYIETADKQTSFKLKVPLAPLDNHTGNPVSWDHLKQRFPGVTMPNDAETEWRLEGDTLHIHWQTDIGTHGDATLERSRAKHPSDYRPLEISSWDDFKTFAIGLDPYRFMFRGQESNRWRLQTHFHRTGRAHLSKFITEDIPALHRTLSSLTIHTFNLADAMENGAFYSLVQHHGYPTPLLDWTQSPFIAAYFAFKNIRRSLPEPDSKVRIFVFDRLQWQKDFNQLQKLSPARPHFSILEALALNNTRMVPQQALSSVTNVDDIEAYIRAREVERNKTYLRVIDLSASERRNVMQELSLMGITAGSLFPGLDGACEQLKERFFDL